MRNRDIHIVDIYYKNLAIIIIFLMYYYAIQGCIIIQCYYYRTSIAAPTGDHSQVIQYIIPTA